MKIAIASIGSPASLSTWSGTPYSIIKSLQEKGHKVIPIHLHRPSEPWYYDWLRRFYHRFRGLWFLSDVEPIILKKISAQLDQSISASNPDLVICIHADLLAFSTFLQPSIVIHDTTFASLLDYYPSFSGLTRRSVQNGNVMYQLALNKSSAVVFSSAWAANSAFSEYSVLARKVYTIPFGANLVNIPAKSDVSAWIENRLLGGISSFLFLGVDWIRKGGPDALRFVRELNRLGTCAKLIVVGCVPTIPDEDLGYVEPIGFLDKRLPSDAIVLDALFRRCVALLLPSLAECYGCVYCEANAYGLPSIGRRTGGVGQIIVPGVNGLLMEPAETPEMLANRWNNLWLDKTAYVNMAFDSRLEFDNRLNYDVFTDRLLREVITTIGQVS